MIPKLPSELYDGTLRVGADTFSNWIPVGPNWRGKIELSLVSRDLSE